MDRRVKPGGDGTGRKAGTSLTVAGAFRRRPGPSKTPYPGLTERRPDMTSSPSLRLSGISKRYPGVQALAGMSFDCLPGEVHAVLGENGSGKSTLLKIAAGAVAADAGRVEIMGAPLTAADPMQARRLGLATVYQDDSLVRELTVAENLYLGCPAGGDHAPPPVAGMASWAAAQLDRYGLDLAPQAIVGSLTPSQRQFLEIVKALTAAPKVLLLDEPTSTLDLPDVEKLTAIIRQAQAAGTAIVYVSHRLPEILDLADRVTILRDGVGRGTYPVGPDLSEAQLVALMVGRPVESEYPAKLGARAATAPVVLEVQDLQGAQFSGLSFQVRAGEVLGFAGAEGNGQRQALRALGGFPKVEETQELPSFRYAEYAEMLGLRGIRVSKPEEVAQAWELALQSDRPCVIDAVVDPNVPTLPPHISFEQGMNFAKSIVKGDADAAKIMKHALKRAVA